MPHVFALVPVACPSLHGGVRGNPLPAPGRCLGAPCMPITSWRRQRQSPPCPWSLHNQFSSSIFNKMFFFFIFFFYIFQRTALHWSSSYGNEEAVKLLIKHVSKSIIDKTKLSAANNSPTKGRMVEMQNKIVNGLTFAPQQMTKKAFEKGQKTSGH